MEEDGEEEERRNFERRWRFGKTEEQMRWGLRRMRVDVEREEAGEEKVWDKVKSRE